MNGRFGTLLVVALGLLLAAVVGQHFARVDSKANPSATSIRPSGAMVFAELLRREGYQVRIDRSPIPRIRSGEAAIAFHDEAASGNPFAGTEPDPQTQRAKDALTEQVKKGATRVVLPIASDFEAAVKLAEKNAREVYPLLRSRPKRLAADPNAAPTSTAFTQPFYGTDGGDDVSISREGKGLTVAFGDGAIATNRLIDKADNAWILLEAVQAVAPAKKVVFTEATFTAELPGLLETLGPWAQALMYQTLFLIAVAIFTLGRRFGLEDTVRRKVRSSRDLADGIADTLKRGRMAGTALGILLEDRHRRRGIEATPEAKMLIQEKKIREEHAVRVAKDSL